MAHSSASVRSIKNAITAVSGFKNKSASTHDLQSICSNSATKHAESPEVNKARLPSVMNLSSIPSLHDLASAFRAYRAI